MWNPDWGQGQTDLRGDELIPTVTVEAQRSAGVQYRAKVLTVNIQGYLQGQDQVPGTAAASARLPNRNVPGNQVW